MDSPFIDEAAIAAAPLQWAQAQIQESVIEATGSKTAQWLACTYLAALYLMLQDRKSVV